MGRFSVFRLRDPGGHREEKEDGVKPAVHHRLFWFPWGGKSQRGDNLFLRL
jgi:hypothetical protein